MRKTTLILGLLALTACASNPEPEPEAEAKKDDDPSYVQNLLGGLERSAVERTRHDMLAVQTALTSYASSEGDFPEASSWTDLSSRIAPTYIRTLPRTDAWGNEFVYERTPNGFLITAPSLDGEAGTKDDIVLGDGGLVQLPEGYRGLL